MCAQEVTELKDSHTATSATQLPTAAVAAGVSINLSTRTLSELYHNDGKSVPVLLL